MKRNAALLLSTVLFIVMCSAVFAVPQHFAAARFELTAPGNSEILKYYYPAAVELKNDIYNTGGGLEYDFAMNDFLTVGAGFNMHFHSYSNNVASANLEEFNFMAVEPYAVTRAFYKAGKDFEVFAGLGTGLLSLAGSTLLRISRRPRRI